MIACLCQVGFGREISLKGHWNDRVALENPHKGWYHHFPDNHIEKYFKNYANSYTVRSPEYFEAVYREKATVLELEHYHKVKDLGNWEALKESSIYRYAPGKTGPDFFIGALELLHATYIGYHGDANSWLTDNPELTVELLNRCGYWYFLHQVEVPEFFPSGGKTTLQMVWENRDVFLALDPSLLDGDNFYNIATIQVGGN